MDVIVTFKPITCCSCGFTFAVPRSYKRQLVDYHTSFYCPACGISQSYTSKSDADILKEKLNRTKKHLDHVQECCISAQKQAAHNERRFYGLKGHVAKLQKQVGQKESPK